MEVCMNRIGCQSNRNYEEKRYLYLVTPTNDSNRWRECDLVDHRVGSITKYLTQSSSSSVLVFAKNLESSSPMIQRDPFFQQ